MRDTLLVLRVFHVFHAAGRAWQSHAHWNTVRMLSRIVRRCCAPLVCRPNKSFKDRRGKQLLQRKGWNAQRSGERAISRLPTPMQGRQARGAREDRTPLPVWKKPKTMWIRRNRFTGQLHVQRAHNHVRSLHSRALLPHSGSWLFRPHRHEDAARQATRAMLCHRRHWRTLADIEGAQSRRCWRTFKNGRIANRPS